MVYADKMNNNMRRLRSIESTEYIPCTVLPFTVAESSLYCTGIHCLLMKTAKILHLRGVCIYEQV
jgi:hypothetical protein